MLDQNNSLLLIIDIQEKLAAAMSRDTAGKNTMKLAAAAETLGMPIVITEQYPKGLGQTLANITHVAKSAQYFEKGSFSIMQEPDIAQAINDSGKKQIIICGMEAHICVHQTVEELIALGYEVYVVKDGIASRNKFEFKQGISCMQQNGAKITCTEIVLFELLRTSKHPNFKEIQSLIK